MSDKTDNPIWNELVNSINQGTIEVNRNSFFNANQQASNNNGWSTIDDLIKRTQQQTTKRFK